MSSIQHINASTPFLVGVPNSQVSREWLRLLNAIVSAVELPSSGITLNDEQTEFYTRRPPNLSDLSRRIEALESQAPPRSASTAIAAMVLDDLTTNATVFPVFANGAAGNRGLRTSSSKWTYNPSTGTLSSTQLVAVAGFGCNGAGAQAAVVSGGAAPAGGTGTAAGGWDTAAHRDAAITLLNNIRLALVANGVMS